MKILFLIATCERPERLRQLLCQIYALSPLPIEVCVVDDASTRDYDIAKRYIKELGGWYCQLDERHGKRRYWEVVDLLFKSAYNQEFDYVFKLDDDVVLHPQAIESAIQMFDTISKHQDKRVLNMWVDHRANQRVWTNVTPTVERIGSQMFRKVGWIDGGNWMANRRVLEILDWSCPEPPEKWWERPGDSSGVGKYLSVALNRLACKIYMPMDSLIYHGAHPSIMHKNKTNRPIQMKKIPWEDN